MGIFSTKKEEGEKAGENPDASAKQEVKAKEVPAQKALPTVKHSPEADACGVILAPIVTEKSHGSAQNGKYTFKVARTTDKKTVKTLIQGLYKVTVRDVNIINVPKKRRTVKYDRGFQKPFKKAIVTLKKGDHIAAFDLT